VLRGPVRPSRLVAAIRRALNPGQSDARPAATDAGPIPDLSGSAVVVADDNRTNAFILGRFLQPTGAEVIMARDGLEAVARHGERRPAAVLMDVSMPGLNGLEATRRIRASEAGAGGVPARIVGVTAYAQAADIEACLRAGMDAVVTKPVDRKALFAALLEPGDPGAVAGPFPIRPPPSPGHSASGDRRVAARALDIQPNPPLA